MTNDSQEPLRTGLISDPAYADHYVGAWHPESPARLQAVLEGIARAVPNEHLLRLAPRAATLDEIYRCHPNFYVEQVREEIEHGFGSLSTGDTDVCRRSYATALLAAGGAIVGVEAVLSSQVRNAFCAVRPPGHHATATVGMGFCIFNNVAVAARHAQARFGIRRVLIVDWDVHHGNGTQDIFYDDPSVYYFSTHEWPLYPGTGAREEEGHGPGRGTTRNCLFPAGTKGEVLIRAFREELVPAMQTFRPELVLISCGFDARKGEPISSLRLEDEDFGELTRIVMDIAAQHASGRLVSVLEGGYGLEGLSRAAGEHVRVLSAGGGKTS